MQLDDNLIRLTLCRGTGAAGRIIDENGSLGLYADLLSAFVLSTNVRSAGAAMEAGSPTRSDAARLIRPGFPYSCFVEQVGEGREHWYGPFEDDITHAFQYGDRADGVTTALVPALRYKKEHKSTTGMRGKYDVTRSVQLQRLMPQGAKIGIRATKSNGRGGPRVFHTMSPGAIRNPVRVQDRALYRSAGDRIEQLTHEWYVAERFLNTSPAPANVTPPKR
jgi:hypothetical protein